MKNISLILIGIILGAAITIPLTKSLCARQVDEEQISNHLDSEFTERFDFGVEYNKYWIRAKSNGPPSIIIELSESNLISFVGIVDRNLNIFQFTDDDLNGKWDKWSYANKGESYSYRPYCGYPYTARVGQDYQIRVDDKYYERQSLGENYFITSNNNQVEVILTNHYWKIKSEPVN